MASFPVTQDLWPTIRGEFERSLSEELFKTWFAPLEAQVEGEDTLVILAPNEFSAIWLEDNYFDLIRD